MRPVAIAGGVIRKAHLQSLLFKLVSLKKQLVMDIQTKKLHFVQEFLRLQDESIIDKLNKLLRSERKKKVENELKPLSKKELDQIIDSAEKDSDNNRLTSASD